MTDVIAVVAGQQDCEHDAAPVGNWSMFRASPAAVNRRGTRAASQVVPQLIRHDSGRRPHTDRTCNYRPGHGNQTQSTSLC